MRRLPVYFLIDVSESMIGDPIQWVEEGMANIVKSLRTDPYALETVHISVIVFAGRARKIISLAELTQFYPPKLPIGGGTALGTALNTLMDDIEQTVVKTTLERKGDWKPIVFLFTDGTPTDNPAPALERWHNHYQRRANLVAVSIGENADLRTLGQLTEHVFRFEDTEPAAYQAFFKWVTASIKATSMSVGEYGKDELLTGNLLDDHVKRIDLKKEAGLTVDNNVAVFLAQCQQTKRHYLIKFKKSKAAFGEEGLDAYRRVFRLQGAHPVDNQYFTLTEKTAATAAVSTRDLFGQPYCPCCGNQMGMITCDCGGIFCVGENEVNTCPWCQTQGRLARVEGNFDIRRTQG